MIIEIDNKYEERLKENTKNAGLNNINEYVSMILDEMLNNDDEEHETEEYVVSEKLKALGYSN